MARRLFPLNDSLIGIPSTGARRGAPALQTDGVVLEAFRDLACTTAADIRSADGATVISTVNVAGVTIEPFQGPDDGEITLYMRELGTTGDGFAVHAAPADALDLEAVQDAVAAMLVAGTNVTLVYDDLAGELTISAAGTGGGLDAESVRDTIAAALRNGSNIQIVHDDAADTITVSATGLALERNVAIDLDSSADHVAHYRIVSDGTSTAGWPNRLEFKYQNSLGPEHVVSWFNEYGEFRTTPAKDNTIGWRAFVGDAPSDFVARDAGVPVIQMVSDRTDRTPLFEVYPNGRIVADNVNRRVETVAEGATGFASMPDGTLWIEYTP